VAPADQDQDQLRLLSILSYAYAGIGVLSAPIPAVFVAIGALLIANPSAFGGGKNAPPAFVGYLFALLGAFAVVMALALAACSFLVGRFLAQRKHRVFCMIVAGANCMHVPMGTALGVFTLIVLSRPSVKAMFVQPPALPLQSAVQQSS
jgi:hypothetical protein